MNYHLKTVCGGWAVFDQEGNRYGMQKTWQAAKRLLEIRRHMALAGAALSSTAS